MEVALSGTAGPPAGGIGEHVMAASGQYRDPCHGTELSLVASDTRPAYVEFEQSFPLAAWLALCLLCAATTLGRRQPAALLWLLAGGGAGLYLCGMDVLYDLEHGIWGQGARAGRWNWPSMPSPSRAVWGCSAGLGAAARRCRTANRRGAAAGTPPSG